MNRLEKEMRKNKKYDEYCKNSENYCKAVRDLGEAFSQCFYFDKILNWLNKFLIKLGF